VVISFDPDEPQNINRLNAFKMHFAIGAGVRILGGYSGQLSNADDRVELLRPDRSPDNQPNFIPYVQEDEVLYDDLPPWPTGADGTGASLTRSALDGWRNAADSWTAAAPSPGSAATTIPGDANDDGVFDQMDLQQVLVAGKYLTGAAATFEQGDFNGDGVFDQRDIVAVLQRGQFQQLAAPAIRARRPATMALADNGFGEQRKTKIEDDRATAAVDELFARIMVRTI
jgi:hypothetical protein